MDGTVDAAVVVGALADYLREAERWRGFRQVAGDSDPAGDGWADHYRPAAAAWDRLVASLGGGEELSVRLTEAMTDGLRRGLAEGHAKA